MSAKTVRPKAPLYFVETVAVATDVTCVFGWLNGYWRFEDLRSHHACVSHETWAKVLSECGYKPLDLTHINVGYFRSISAEADENAEVTS